jgi:1-acyl-sn-glycerol-3-phosphate acyltransferase
MVSVLLAAERMPSRNHYAPMDAAALARYGILKRVGIFPVAIDSARGAAQVLRTSLSALAQGGVLWVTPQGRFADARERPLHFKPGLASLATRVPGGCTLLPLAIEYTFWDERMPETLLHFGTPIYIDGGDSSATQQRLQTALLQTMDELATLAIARDPRNFELLRSGRAGTGGFYAFFQRLWSLVRGKPYQADHTPQAVHTPAISRPGAGE